MNNTPTPRTDEAAWIEADVVEASFARQLERELAAVTEQLDAARSYKRVLKNENQRLRSAIRKIGQLSHTTDQSALWNAIEDAQRILPKNAEVRRGWDYEDQLIREIESLNGAETHSS